MKLKKPERSVSNMDVLKDIRGLLSVTRERQEVTSDGVIDESSLEDETDRLETRIKYLEELVQKQGEVLHRVENEKEEFAAKLQILESGKDNLITQSSKSSAPGEEAAQLEARIAELTSALSQIDGLLKLKVQELSKKIARLFQEAGQGEVAIEFRKAAGELEVVENFTHFIRALLE